MFYIGPHVSISESLALAPERAKALGATGFAMFTKNQRQWKVPPLRKEQCDEFKEAMAKNGYTADMVLPHDGYLINLGQPDKEKRRKSVDSFVCELERCRDLGLKYLNFHPGAHTGLTDEETCLSIIAKSIDEALDRVSGVMPVLENTAGQGSYMGYSLESLKTIIDRSEHKDELGVCIDTCHAFQAGYDFSSVEKAKEFFSRFDDLLPGRLRGMHLNDAKAEIGKHLDRHESIGKGKIGLDTFLYICSDKRFEGIPLILETPNEELWKEEVSMLQDASK